MPSHRRLQQYAIAISIVSIFYNGAEGAISIAFGAESSSKSLVFFGAQSAIEVASAAMVIWRFKNIAKPGEEKGLVLGSKELRVEKVASMTIGILLVLLALATEATAITSLALHDSPSSSTSSLIISASALAFMVALWLPKRYLARVLDSSAMAGEAACSLSCIQITLALFVGALVSRLWHGGWWVDSATALVLGCLFAWEGVKMLRWARDPAFNGGCCGACALPAASEMDTQYRDLCGCCIEKNECKEAGSCTCGSDVESGCCTPTAANGIKCCTHQVSATPPLPRPRQDQCCDNPAMGSCCENEQKTSLKQPNICGDSCCSKKPEVNSCCIEEVLPTIIHDGLNCERSCCSVEVHLAPPATGCSSGCCGQPRV